VKKAVFLAGLIVAAGGLGLSAFGARPVPDRSSAAIRAAEAWAFPVFPSADEEAVKPDPRTVLHVAGSTRSYTLGELGIYHTPDWFPQDHPPLPRIVAQGRKPAWACAFCHGPEGEGVPATAALTGLPKTYILEQLAAFRLGQRGASLPRTTQDMAHEARSADEADLRQAAAYFSALSFRPETRVIETATVPKTHWEDFVLVPDRGGAREPIGERIIVTPANMEDYDDHDFHTEYVAYVPPGSIERGASIAAKGDGAALPCESCHGASLQGIGNIPPLAGRSPAYIVRELILFKTGARRNAQALPMRREAAHLTVHDMISAAAYIASLGPRRSRQ
jgi:cytochrome c553